MPGIAQTADSSVAVDQTEELLYRKVLKRILPLLLLCYVVAYLDRVNVGFAKLQMLDSLGLSDAVYGLATVPDHRPEHAWRHIEPGDWDPREFRAPGARPSWLLGAARRLEPGRFELLAGPERIECGWWDGRDVRRDYFVAGTPDDALVWIYRDHRYGVDDGEWFLHGVYA